MSRCKFLLPKLILLICFPFSLASCGLPGFIPAYEYANKDAGSLFHSEGESSKDESGQIIVFVALSGGGFRAAAFSYGVLEGLSQVNVKGENAAANEPHSMWNEIDFISGISGGAITAAHFAVSHNQIDEFRKFAASFLNKDAEIRIFVLRGILNPLNWPLLTLTHYNRAHLAADYYESQLFSKKKTFGQLSGRPELIIGTTDIVGGQPFEFTETAFACIGSRLDEFRIAQAVAASSAYPIVFPSVTLKNFSTNPTLCRDDPDYLDKVGREYLHLQDGGIGDNTGVYAFFKLLQTKFLVKHNTRCLKGILLITVDANSFSPSEVGRKADPPGPFELLPRAFSMLQDELIKQAYEKIRIHGEFFQGAVPGYAPTFKNVHINFDKVRDIFSAEETWHSLNAIPTRLSLKSSQIETLVTAGRSVALHYGHEMRQFFEDANAVQSKTCHANR